MTKVSFIDNSCASAAEDYVLSWVETVVSSCVVGYCADEVGDGCSGSVVVSVDLFDASASDSGSFGSDGSCAREWSCD